MESMLPSVKARCLCEVLLEARRQAGLTQTQLAEKLQVPQSTIAKMENGDRGVGVVELPEITQALGLSMVQLVTRFAQAMQFAARPQGKGGGARSFRAR